MAGDHYIQQKYLRGFELPDNPGAVAFWHRANNKAVGTTGTRVICSEKDFYTTYDEDENKSRIVDDHLTAQLEPGLTAILNRLQKSEPFTQNEMLAFSRYIVFKFYMVPAWRELHSSLSKRYLAHLKDRKQPNIWANELFSSYLKEAEKLANMHWRVYKAPKESTYLTSDNPVTCVNNPSGSYAKGTEGGVGGQLGAEHNHIYLPLDKNHMLQIWSDYPRGFEYMNANKSRVATYNTYTQINCYNYIIGSSVQLVKKYSKMAISAEPMLDLKKTQLQSVLDATLQSD